MSEKNFLVGARYRGLVTLRAAAMLIAAPYENPAGVPPAWLRGAGDFDFLRLCGADLVELNGSEGGSTVYRCTELGEIVRRDILRSAGGVRRAVDRFCSLPLAARDLALLEAAVYWQDKERADGTCPAERGDLRRLRRMERWGLVRHHGYGWDLAKHVEMNGEVPIFAVTEAGRRALQTRGFRCRA